jgi:3-phosphoshikimate 1-carboxyvinyltransferase
MADLRIAPSRLQGSLSIPPSKSHTLRAILFAALADGVSHVEPFLLSPDTQAMIHAVRLLGAEVETMESALRIRGCGGRLRVADDVIQCGNSGQVLRFIGALASLIPQYTILTGDASIRRLRPIQPLLGALQQLGAFAASSRGDGYAPILVRGPWTRTVATLDGQDSQPVSGLLIAGAFAPHPVELHVTNPGETPWIDLTLSWLRKLRVPYRAEAYTHYRVEGSAHITGFTYRVPGDFSTAAFPIAAALLTQSSLTLHNIDMNDVQGDKALIAILEQMGARFLIDKERQTLTVEPGSRLQGMRIDMEACIDALPILAVVGCFAEGRTELVNAAIARKKESDRIACITRALAKMGACIEERADGLLIRPAPLCGAELDTHHDHRIALSLSVAALAAKGPSVIRRTECIEKSYPDFAAAFLALGAKISL